MSKDKNRSGGFSDQRLGLGLEVEARGFVRIVIRNMVSSHGFATRVHGFATKTNALAREIPPATQATLHQVFLM